MQQQTWKSEPSIGSLFGDLARESNLLLKQEIQLAKVELKDSAAHVGKGVSSIAVGAVFGIGAMLCLLTTVVALLATFMAVWLAALIVAIVVGIVGFIFVQKGIKELKEHSLAPRATIETVREDVIWLKNRA